MGNYCCKSKSRDTIETDSSNADIVRKENGQPDYFSPSKPQYSPKVRPERYKVALIAYASPTADFRKRREQLDQFTDDLPSFNLGTEEEEEDEEKLLNSKKNGTIEVEIPDSLIRD